MVSSPHLIRTTTGAAKKDKQIDTTPYQGDRFPMWPIYMRSGSWEVVLKYVIFR